MHVLKGLGLALFATAAPAAAQTATTTEGVRTAYGARLTQPEGVEVNARRINNRVSGRINNRLSTRLERYRVARDPLAPLRVDPTDATRETVEVRPVPQAEDEQE